MSSKRVLIVSSYGLFREGLRRLLAEVADLVILDQVSSLKEANDLALQEKVDVVIVDQAEGINHQTSRNEALSYLIANPDVRVISVSLDTEDMRVYKQQRVVEASVEDLVAALQD
jgi:DNA-binding NarL/FixJ family response regulator